MKLPPYDNFPIISDDKITLRPIMPSDIKDIIEISFYDGIQAATLKQATEMQSKINKDYTDGNSIHWGIAENTTNAILGTCGYYRGFDQESGELGCVLLPQFRGKGFMTAAMKSAIDFGINTIELKRIWALTTKQNENAIKLLEKLNFVKIADWQDDEIEYEWQTKSTTLRNLALSLPETSEAPHFEKTSFRVGKKIFVTVDEKKQEACIKLSETDQDVFSLGDKTIVYPVPNKWGKQGWTIIDLTRVHSDLLKDAVLTAYREVAPKKLSDLVK
ncbi:GNAT family N-acetyltransferase [Flavobacterium terrisoli]|uniref:GNAT family N-acetyltransferase n=1 Tax=Flavobacterium terrisoli TaxID=3242195 RepID=UPI002542896D|nr:GNAT family N-acetyltransferase [Flavobacterium buctense]